LGAITETEGTVAPWGTDGPAEALITIDTDLLGQLLSGPLLEATGPDHLIELAARPGPRGAEHAVRRKLVENPVVLQSDLPPDQVEWLRRNQRRESSLLDRNFGLVTETRLEGVAVTDPEDYLTDVLFPGSGTVARIALLALPELIADPDPELFADDVEPPEPRPDGRHPVQYGQVRVICAQLVEDYPAAWSRQATEDLDRLTADVLDLLVRMGLAVDDPEDGWLIAPTAHRWVPQPDDTPARNAPPPPPVQPEEPGWSLFDGEGEL
jgi:uncharacterized protein (TIGR02678 family)